MISDNTYYKNEFYIPLAKPSLGSTESVQPRLKEFIYKYEYEFIVRCLGKVLGNAFWNELDISKPTGLKDGSDEKWNRLLNGHTYTDPQGDEVTWKGIRRKAIPTDESYSVSLTVNYVYYHWEQNEAEKETGVGHGKAKAKNFIVTGSTRKVVRAWNELVELIQGREVKGIILDKTFGLGVDYFMNENNESITLYKFIDDMNNIQDEYYPNFKKYDWKMMNSFGI